MRNSLRRLWLCVGLMISSTAVQGAGCTTFTGDQLVGELNGAAQSFLTSIFAQWVGLRVDALFNV